MKTVFEACRRRLFPHFCCFCHAATDTDLDLCSSCLSVLPTVTTMSHGVPDTLCLGCGSSQRSQAAVYRCNECAMNMTPFAHIVAPFRFVSPVKQLVHRLKYQQQLYLGRLFGELLADAVAGSGQSLPELLVPVPMHAARLRERGSNHAGEIARGCARRLRIPDGACLATREVETAALAGQTRAERAVDIRGAFRVDESVAGRRVAIVDDVLTTGATAGELATELLDTGARQVQLWVVARTPRPGPDR